VRLHLLPEPGERDATISLCTAATSSFAALSQVELITTLNGQSRGGAYRFVFAHPDPFST